MNPPKKSPEQALMEKLRTIFDPELGVNIVDLGLIYSIRVNRGIAKIEMTLTTRACPVGEVLVSAVWHVASAAPGIRKAEVKLVWDPPWSLERISDNLRQNSDLF